MAFCCSPLKSVSINPPELFYGIYGLSPVLAKGHLFSSLGYVSVRHCSACMYPNDSDANYCQTCGTSTGLQLPATATVRVDEAAIQERFNEFQSVMCSNPDQRMKSALELQLSQFLGAFSPPWTVTLCTANDIVKFRFSKNKSGRTVVHSSSCPRASCTCPKRLAPGSVDSFMGRLRAIFNNLNVLMILAPSLNPL